MGSLGSSDLERSDIPSETSECVPFSYKVADVDVLLLRAVLLPRLDVPNASARSTTSSSHVGGSGVRMKGSTLSPKTRKALLISSRLRSPNVVFKVFSDVDMQAECACWYKYPIVGREVG